ncbi:putative esterase [Aspergillus pseudonomiae]|uniref:S-formylglutathione hydrolase n=1 Tax=Aspergillus pseudonomiae TaxID=1506151 RepID=A0A5N7DS81_9EURO|nr:putative esterase [Aspergillus pseudonomiae]KAB8264298.1 putative esterase [Aspergillus pseudonomiae]KAE8409145.1 putative esterase [Aspergillus pseudonomiae]
MVFTTKAVIASFGGKLLKLSHKATSTRCEMAFNLYLPPQAFEDPPRKIPVMIYLSGLTWGLNIPGENDSWDFGTGAGFYVDATQKPYNESYNMYTYVREELPNVVFQHFPQLDPERVSITGHSMGGHGALMLYLRNPGKYRSVSAFAPICNPINCPWGQKAFSGYLGENYQDLWKEYDSTELVKGWKGPLKMLIDVGTGDNFYRQGQLLPENFEKAVTEAGVKGLQIRYRPDYDHSYYTMASFSDDHVAHAAKYLV